MKKCVAPHCSNTSEGSEEKTFHRFPFSNLQLSNKWIVNINSPDFIVVRESFLCSEHFERNCFEQKDGNFQLKEDAVPTIFCSANEEVDSSTKAAASQTQLTQTKIYLKDHSYVEKFVKETFPNAEAVESDVEMEDEAVEAAQSLVEISEKIRTGETNAQVDEITQQVKPNTKFTETQLKKEISDLCRGQVINLQKIKALIEKKKKLAVRREKVARLITVNALKSMSHSRLDSAEDLFAHPSKDKKSGLEEVTGLLKQIHSVMFSGPILSQQKIKFLEVQRRLLKRRMRQQSVFHIMSAVLETCLGRR